MTGFKIGNIEIKNKLVLGPMAGITDLPFRILCKEQGAGLTYTEMVSAKGIKYNNKNTEELLTVDERERPASVQIFGEDAGIMGEMAARLEERNFDILDVNMGCPVPKVVNNGEGSALMKDIKKIENIIRSLKKNTKKPVTIKIRSGFSQDNINAVEVAKAAEAAGADGIAVHGRTREAFYSGKADWKIIKRVKDAVKIPIIGSGDAVSPETAKLMLDETGCDGIMIARAARGNPWIFSEINAYLEKGKKLSRPSEGEVLSTVLRHARLLIEYKGAYIGIREMRKHALWYTAGYPGSAKFRAEMSGIESYEELKKLMKNYLTRTVHGRKTE